MSDGTVAILWVERKRPIVVTWSVSVSVTIESIFIEEVKQHPVLQVVPDYWYFQSVSVGNKFCCSGDWRFVLFMYFIISFLMLLSSALSANNYSLRELHGENCLNLDGGEYTYYVQLVNGICTNELPSETDASTECIQWKDSSFWNDFANSCDSLGFSACQEYAAEQANSFAKTNEILFALALSISIFNGLLKFFESLFNKYMTRGPERIKMNGCIYSLITLLQIVIQVFVMIIAASIDCVGWEQGLPHGNQLVDNKNWLMYYGCTESNSSSKPLSGHSSLTFSIILAPIIALTLFPQLLRNLAMICS